jgi:transcriptional regulator with XRE-family HTH domain
MSDESDNSQLPSYPAQALIVGGSMRKAAASEPTPLSLFVRRRLEELEMKQSDFCRLTGFDQGLLSKIQNSVINSLSLESALRLAIGLSVSPRVIFKLTDRTDMQDLVIRAYAKDFFPELAEMQGVRIPGQVLEITRMALFAHSLGRSLVPAYTILSYLTAARRGSKDKQFMNDLRAGAGGI